MDAGARAQLIAAVHPTHVLHLAWFVTPGQFWTSRENLAWVQASLDLFEVFGRQGREGRWVGAGTCAEYDWSRDEPFRETTSLLYPATLYGAAKHALHTLQRPLAREMSVSLAWGRVFLLYGPWEAPARLVPSVIRSLLRGEPALCTEGLQRRDFLHVEDVARAFATLLDSDYTGPANICTGRPVEVREVAVRLGEIIGRPELLRLGAVPSRAEEPDLLSGDTAVLESLGFRPQYSLQEGLTRTVEWWRHRVEGGTPN
jgi:nucleoside-diphosphate-sugar epimerase